MSAHRDIIDAIDELVDEQMANYENRSGYDHNVNQDKCWHCGYDWHGLPITERIMAMKARRRYDEDYRVSDDDSPVICPGSEFIGPIPPRRPPQFPGHDVGPRAPGWLQQMIAATEDYVHDMVRSATGTPPRGFDLSYVTYDELLLIQPDPSEEDA